MQQTITYYDYWKSDCLQAAIDEGVEVLNQDLILLDPIALIDISLEDPKYRTLLINRQGQARLSKQTVAWVGRQFFTKKLKAFNYEVWNTFLQQKTGRLKTTFPYVHGYNIWLKLSRRDGSRRFDWLNLTDCCDFDLRRHPEDRKRWILEATYHLRGSQHLPLVIQHTDLASTIRQQVACIPHLCQVWRTYYQHQASLAEYVIAIDYSFSQPEHPLFTLVDSWELNPNERLGLAEMKGIRQIDSQMLGLFYQYILGVSMLSQPVMELHSQVQEDLADYERIDLAKVRDYVKDLEVWGEMEG